jgi:hypothetical protein
MRAWRLRLLNRRRLRDDRNSLFPLDFLLALRVGCALAGGISSSAPLRLRPHMGVAREHCALRNCITTSRFASTTATAFHGRSCSQVRYWRMRVAVRGERSRAARHHRSCYGTDKFLPETRRVANRSRLAFWGVKFQNIVGDPGRSVIRNREFQLRTDSSIPATPHAILSSDG